VPVVEALKESEQQEHELVTWKVEKPAGNVEARLRKRAGKDGRGVTAREHGEQHDANLSGEPEADCFGGWLHMRERRLTVIIQPLCTAACSPDTPKPFAYHGLMKADLRISVKDHRRAETSKIQLAQVNCTECPPFLVRMSGTPGPPMADPFRSQRSLPRYARPL
jgi:hypothetical protein